MDSAVYNIRLRKGDTYYGPLITLPDLSTFGGPSTLDEATVTAELRYREESTTPVQTFNVEIVDAAARKLRPRMAANKTGTLVADGFWRLRVVTDEWAGTPLRGKVLVNTR